MRYEEFQRHIGKAGLSQAQFADLIKMNRISLSNYAKQGVVPAHLAIIVALLGEMAEKNVDFLKPLSRIDIKAKKPRGGGASNQFGGDPQRLLPLHLDERGAGKNRLAHIKNERKNADDTSDPDCVVSDNSKMTRHSVISLFSGCGGMDLGFLGGFEFLGSNYKKNPFDIIWANELNAAACGTYSGNIGSHIHQGDIWKVMDILPEQADVVIGGFPCQDISVNGKGEGVGGKRSGLYLAMVEVIKRVKPKIFVAENVKGLLMKHHASALETVLKDFRSLGYEVSYHLYLAADYGVPQTRERVIIVGRKKDVNEYQVPAKTHDPDSYISAFSAIHDLVGLEECASFNHIWSRANRSPEQGDRRLKVDRPGYTIRAECHGNIQWHYELPRRISMREAARLQSFPDSFLFQSKLRETERQVGNAVPPVLAWHVARSVVGMLST